MLKISDSLKLPHESVTQTFAVLGKRGSGKTNFAVVLVEEMVRAQLPVVVIDPVGVWHGLRSSADGKSEGLPVAILGGEHGQVPLEKGAGGVIAEFVAEARQSCVLDLSLFRKGEQTAFMQDFAERLYQVKATKRDALHVVVDEADAYCPQRPMPNEARLLGAMEDLIRRGRSRGVGMTLITQRPAVLNKNVLTQAEALVVFRMTGPHDRAAIDEWVKMNGEGEQRAELMTTIASLPVGTAWFWSPGWLDVFKKVNVRRRDTFDSSATPKAGAKTSAPKVLAAVDLEALRTRIASTIERAKADDPKVLRARIAELEGELAKASAATKVERVEVPVVAPATLETLNVGLNELRSIVAALSREVDRAGRYSPEPARRHEPVAVPAKQASKTSAPRPAASTGGTSLGKCERSVLTVLAQHGTRTNVQIAILSGYSHSSGGFRNALSSLRSAGHIVGGGERIEITATGRKALGHVEPLPRGRALLEYWMANAGGKCERAILDVLASAYPRAVAKDVVAERAGYQATSGGFRNSLSRLRTLQLMSGGAELRLADPLGHG